MQMDLYGNFEGYLCSLEHPEVYWFGLVSDKNDVRRGKLHD